MRKAKHVISSSSAPWQRSTRSTCEGNPGSGLRSRVAPRETPARETPRLHIVASEMSARMS